MKIIIDGDATPDYKDVILLAKENNIKVDIYVDTSHEITSDYANVIVCSVGANNVDLNLINNVTNEDIVITSDYGLASLVLHARRVINPSGFIYTTFNIDSLLLNREISRKSKKYTKIKKRTKENKIKFLNLIKENL